MSELKLPYPRPRFLSDPNHDFTPYHLAAILAKPDRDLDWRDYQAILGPYLPAGTYEESAYFLPLAFDYLVAHDENAGDLISAVVGFSSKNANNLQRDAVREKLSACLAHRTSHFEIRHFDLDDCRKNGWTRPYFDQIPNSHLVVEFIRELVHFNTHADLAFGFFADLGISQSDPVKSAWFLEMARTYHFRDIIGLPRHPEIKRWLEDKEIALEHAAIVWDQPPAGDPDATYWTDTFTLLTRIP